LTAVNGTPRLLSRPSALWQISPHANVYSVTGNRSAACCVASGTVSVSMKFAPMRFACAFFASDGGGLSE
jgi:hypothetical protein